MAGGENLKIAIIGVGMVGGPLARFFQEVAGRVRGRDLFLFDTDPQKEYGDDPNLADIIFISVPTPRGEAGAVKIDAIEKALATIRKPKIIVIKSTVPPGTTEMLQTRYPMHKMLFNPEFLTEAHAWENTLHPERQLIGFTEKSKDIVLRVLALLPKSSVPSFASGRELSATEAEIIKYAANVFLTRKVTFANAIYNLARHHGVDYEHIRAGIASDSRIGPSHLDAKHHGYRGYGGYCFVKDIDGLIAHLRAEGLTKDAELFEADRTFNTRLLASQGLTPEDVSMHDHEWIAKKMNKEL